MMKSESKHDAITLIVMYLWAPFLAFPLPLFGYYLYRNTPHERRARWSMWWSLSLFGSLILLTGMIPMFFSGSETAYDVCSVIFVAIYIFSTIYALRKVFYSYNAGR